MPPDGSAAENGLEPAAVAFYRQTLGLLDDAGVEFLVGGAFAFERYTGIGRDTKDFDLFVRPQDAEGVLRLLERHGYHSELTYPHWLGKIYRDEHFVDIIFGSGNGVSPVDDAWFAHAREDLVLGTEVRLSPPEEMIWSKAFIMERERFDGADVLHLLHACYASLDWERLLKRFDGYWRVLLSHLTLFGFVYPGDARRIPGWVMRELMARLDHELRAEPPSDRLCRGTLLSRSQYLVDIERWGYQDARPRGTISQAWHDAAAGHEPPRPTPQQAQSREPTGTEPKAPQDTHAA